MTETIVDTQNAKAANFAVDEAFMHPGETRLPLMIRAQWSTRVGARFSGRRLRHSLLEFHAHPKDGLLNCVTGCCGTFPSHIAALKKACEDRALRKLPELPKFLMVQLSGLEQKCSIPESGLSG